MRQVSGSIGQEGSGSHCEGVNPVSEVAFALAFPAAGLDYVLPIDGQAEFFLYCCFDIGLESIDGSANGCFIFDVLFSPGLDLFDNILDVDEPVLFG